MISNPAKNTRAADILLCSGVNEREVKEKNRVEKLLLQYSWNTKYEADMLIGEKEIIRAVKTKDGITEIFNSISQYVKDITDSDVEMQGIK